jgi:hypothetical protein
MRPAFTKLPMLDVMLTLLTAESVAPVVLVMEPPALMLRCPELETTPELRKFRVAARVKLVIGVRDAGRMPALPAVGKFVVIRPVDALLIFIAPMETALMAELVETAYMEPAFVKLPLMVKVEAVENLSMAVTFWGMTRLLMREARVLVIETVPPTAAPEEPRMSDWVPVRRVCITATACAGVSRVLEVTA